MYATIVYLFSNVAVTLRALLGRFHTQSSVPPSLPNSKAAVVVSPPFISKSIKCY